MSSTTRTTSTTTRSQELADFFEAQESELLGLLTAIGFDALQAHKEGNHEWLDYDLRAYRSQLGAVLGSARHFRAMYDLKARKERGEY